MGKQIRAIREAMGLSRPAFAALLDVPAATIKNYELGYREAVPASLLRDMYHKLPAAQRKAVLAMVTTL